MVQGHGHGEGVPHTADEDWVGEVALPGPALWVSKHAIQVRPRAYERAQRRERFKAVTSRALTSWTNAQRAGRKGRLTLGKPRSAS